MRESSRRANATSLLARPVGTILLTSLLQVSCGTTPPSKPHRLPSGRELAVFHAAPAGDGWHLVYLTQLPLSRKAMLAHLNQARAPVPAELQQQLHALQCEAETLVADVEASAEAAGLRKATIAPTSTKRELIGFRGWLPEMSVGRSIEFELGQGGDGVWRQEVGWTARRCE